MTREIKFRAWTKEKEMKYNVVPFQWDYCLNRMWHKCIESNGAGILGSGGTEAKFEVEGFAIEDSALMQFTGLLDKNGKEVYFGDKVRINGEYDIDEMNKIEDRIIEVEDWVDVVCQFGLENAIEAGMTIEVIGNIYENA